MPLTRKACPKCSQVVEPSSTTCPACGLSFDATHPLRDLGPAPVKGLQLTGPSDLKLRIVTDCYVLRRSVCVNMFGDVAACVSEKGQCEFLRKNEFTWAVKPASVTVNAAILDGKELISETVLEDGMTLAVGNMKSGTMGLVLKISLIV